MSNLTEQYCNQIENALKHYLPQTGGLQERLVQSMTYSLLDGGKRIRPILVLEFNRLCGGIQSCNAVCLRSRNGTHLFFDSRRFAMYGQR